jgi:hypothetical protein
VTAVMPASVSPVADDGTEAKTNAHPTMAGKLRRRRRIRVGLRPRSKPARPSATREG